MPQNANDVKRETIVLWLDAALRQVVAESYSHGISLSSTEVLSQRLTRGNTPLESTEGQYIRLTQSQATTFLTQYEVVDHHANDATGFSATLLRRKSDDPLTGARAGEYSLAFRSTEYKNPSQGGDFDRDGFLYGGIRRADGEIAFEGFAQGQIAAMESYYQRLRLGFTSTDPDNSALLNTAGKVNTAVRDFFTSTTNQFNVVGYSLGASLATVFTERHPEVVNQTLTFNAAGRGMLARATPGAEGTRLEEMYTFFNAVLHNPDVGLAALRKQLVAGVPALDSVARSLYILARGSMTGAYSPFELHPANLALDPTRRKLYDEGRYRWAYYAVQQKYSPSQPGTSASRKDITVETGPFEKITQLFGHANFGDSEVTANSGVHAPTTSIYIEAQPFLEGAVGKLPFAPELTASLSGLGDFGNAHSLTLIIDSLAVIEAFMTVDGSLTKRQVEAIFSGASSQGARELSFTKDSTNAEGNSLELPLDALRKLYGAQGAVVQNGQEIARVSFGQEGWRTPVDRANGGFGNADFRATLHRNIELLKDKIVEKGMATIVSLVPEGMFRADNGEPIAGAAGRAADFLAEQAKSRTATGIAYRYALRELTPFVVTGNEELYPALLQGELSYHDPATGEGMLSEQWVDDRAKLLATNLAFNIQNRQFELELTSSELLLDQASATRLALLTEDEHLTVSTFNERQLERFLSTLEYDKQTVFGKDDPKNKYEDSIAGDRSIDRLYGGRGDDQLDGRAAADFLDGGVGEDQLFGGAGDDELLGGADADVLRGGEGSDIYIWRRGDSFDTIIDFAGDGFGGDGLGKIEFLGTDLAGDKQLWDPATNDKLFGDANYFYALTGELGSRGTLTIVKQDEFSTFGGIRIEGFKNGDLGINLVGTPTFTKTDQSGTNGNDQVTVADAFRRFFGLAGNDRIVVSLAHAEGWGGTGDDFVSNDDGDQTLRGEEGRDILLASAGNDRLHGGTENDALQGGEGDDLLSGDEGDDVLDGGLGSDVINGGTGSDFLAGGGTLVVGAPWSAASVPVFGALTSLGQPTGLVGMTGLVASDGDTGDVLDGGSGNDTIFSGSGDDFAKGGEGDDLISGDADSDTLSGGDGADVVFGDATQGSITIGGQDFYTLAEFHGNDVLLGGFGDDTLQGDGGADDLYGGEDDDVLVGDAATLDESFHGADYLDGGDGNDQLLGYGKGDSLFGGAGNDVLGGDSSSIAASLHGEDYLDGEEGDDTLHGDGGADRLFGGAGNDVLDGDASNVAFEFHGADYLEGEDGNDALQGGGGADALYGGAGNDSLIGDGAGVPVAFAGDDYLDGEAGADVLEGGAGDDTLIGGAGSDILRGQAGDDLYVVTTGDQQDFVDDTEGANTIRFDSGGTFAGMSVFQSLGSDGKAYLEIRHATGDSVYVRDGLTNLGIQYEFADGTVRSAADWRSKFTTFTTVSGTSGADDLAGTLLANSFAPGAGNDTIRFAPGSGFDRISGFGQVTGESPGLDVVRAGGGLTSADLEVRRDSSSHLYLTIRETGDVLRLDSWGTSSARAHAGPQVVFDDGSGLSAADLIVLAAAGTGGADFLAGGSGDDVIDGGAGDDRIFGVSNSNPVIGAQDSNVLLGGEGNDQLSGGFGDDVLDGGPGDDTLSGGTGADIHRWGLGDGNDVITDGIGEGNIVELKPGLTPADVTLVQGSIVIYANATGESLTLSGWYSESGLPSGHVPFVTVEELRFADGTVWNASLINEMANHATPFADLLRGMSGADVLYGLGGDDTLEGFSGDDVLAGGDGADDLDGGAGGDDLDGGAGNDHLDGGSGDDVLRGGAGDDLLSGGSGHDVYLFGAGDGADRIVSSENAVIEFDESIEAADARLRFDGGKVVLDYGSGQVQLTVGTTGSFAAHGIDLVRFADGTFWNRDEILARTEILPSRFIGTAAAESIVGGSGDDFIDGMAGGDTLAGVAGDDVVLGGEGADWLDGAGGNDYLDGGAGDDRMIGGLGSDTYRFGFDTGVDIVSDSRIDPFHHGSWPGDLDVIVVDAGVQAQDVSVSRQGADLLLATSTSSLSVAGWFGSQFGPGPLAVRFVDGTEWDVATLSMLAGYVAPVGLDDVLEGTPGDDLLEGGYGNDVYLFGYGSGNDTIQEAGNSLSGELNRATAGRRDTIRFGPGVAPQDVFVDFDSDRPQFMLLGTGETLTVASWQDAAGGRVEFAEFDDGTVWDLGRFDYWSGSSSAGPGVPDFVTGSKLHFPGISGPSLGMHDEIFFGQGLNDVVSDIHGHQTLYGGAGNDNLTAGNGDDQLDGGAGNDSLSPGTGDNRIRFGRGFGQDTLIRPPATESLGVDVIIFGDDVPQEQVRLRRGPNASLILQLAGTPDSLVINGALRGLAGRDRVRFEFADGTQWGPDQIEAHIQAVAVIEGGTGNNTLTGGDGDDFFIGGEGNDTLIGGGGNDTFLFHRGDGVDTVNDKYPRIAFGDGVAPGDVTLSGTNFAAGQRNLILTVSGGGGQLTLGGWFDTAGIDGSIEFSDGTVWDAAYVGTLVPFAWVSGTSGSFFGTPGNDVHSAGATNDTLRGHAGDDTLSGNGGNDQVFGGDGSDVLAGGAGTDNLGGEAGDDQLSGGDGDDVLNGGGGNDALEGNAGDDNLSGSAGGDALDGGAGDDQLAGGMGDDILVGGDGADVLEGGLENDLLEGGTGDDRLYGGAGSDTYVFGPGSGHDTLFDYDGTGADFDTVLVADGVSPDGVTAERQGGDIVLALVATGDSLAIRSFGRPGFGVERVSFSDGTEWDGEELRARAGLAAPGGRADVIYGTGDADLLAGLDGDDYLAGEAGADLLEGGAGDDVLEGGEGADTLDGGEGADHLAGGDGADLFLVRTDSGSDSVADLSDGDTLSFGPGIAAGEVFVTRDRDNLYLELGATGQFVTLENWFSQGAGGEVAFEDGTRWGGAFLKPLVDALTDGDDFHVGSAGADHIESLGGLDTVFAAAGDDVVLGGSGSDTLHGEAGADQLFGEAGYDLLQGGEGNDALEGGDDDDALFGEAGNDVLRGGDGFDELEGGAGDDQLEGGAGDELLRGGAGSDVYVFAPGFGSDTLIDSDNMGSDVNVARFSGIAPEDVSFTWSGTEFLLEIEGSTDTLLLRDSLIPHFTAVRTIEFDDGTAWDDSQIYLRTTYAGTEGNDTLAGGFKALLGFGGNDILTGGGGDEFLDGGEGNDTLDGRSGSDVLVGGAGSDTYRFGPNWGHDVIREDDAGAPGTDTVILLAELPEVSIARVGQDIVIEIDETGATLTLEGWYDSPAHQVELLRFEEDVVWDAQTLGAYADAHQAPPERAPLALTAAPEEPAAVDDAPPGALLAVAVPGFTFGGDFIRGSGGDDILDALPGDDSAFGGPGADQLLGGEGDDFLGGEAGDDVLDGGAGRDILEGGLGDDSYLFGAGYGEDWVIDAGGADEVLVDASLAPSAVAFTRDLSNLYLTSGADRLVLVDWFHRTDTRIETIRFGDGTTFDETAVRLAIAVLAATTGADTIFGSDRGDSLLGLAGEDALYGEGGDDILDGGAGSDYLLGGHGNDSYHVDNHLDRATELADEGVDTVTASASYTLLPHVENLVLAGAAALNGTGNSGDNTLTGNSGANALRGAAGNDLLRGGVGNDSYLYDVGDGEDVIVDIDATAGNLDELRFGSGISAAGVRVSRVGDDVRLRLPGEGEVLLRHWFDPVSRVETVRFADGTSWDTGTIENLANAPANEPPVLQLPIEDAMAAEDAAFTRTLPPGTFVDPDQADTLVLTASLADGAPLPAWLAFDAASGTFAGTPGNDDVGAYSIRVTAADPAGESVADDFVLTVVNANDAPQLALPLADQSIAAGSEFTLALQGGTFTDADAGDILTYSASRADGGALPAWLTFDASSRTFSGNPADGDAGLLAVRVTATDLAGATASDEFGISVSAGEVQGKHLVGTRHGDILVGTPHDDVIEGRKGDDWLFGRQGDDLYLFGKGDGDDLVWDSGGEDRLRFAEGVEKRDVNVVRRHDDLVLKFKRGGDTVTLKNWFDSAGQRVERVEFADGGSWNESDLRARAKWDYFDGWFGWDEHRDWDGGRDHHDGRRRSGEGHRHSSVYGGHEHGLRDASESLVARIARAANFDFSQLAAAVRRDRDEAGGPMSAERFAVRWRDVQQAVQALAQDDHDSGQGAQRVEMEVLAGDLESGHGWGHAGSTGQRHGGGGMQSFAGLGEGFRNLG